MTVRVSDDDGVSWSDVAVLHEGPSAYSSLAGRPDGRVACLFECGVIHPYETIAVATMDVFNAQRMRMQV